jgi:tetratricopeptide (TPR) repeat protein
MIGKYYMRRGDFDRASESFQHAAVLEPKNAVWQVLTGDALVQDGDLVAALIHYQKATELEPTNPFYWLTLVEFCVKNYFQVEEIALPAARRLLALSPDEWRALDAMGNVLLHLGNMQSAEDYFLQAIDADSMQALPHLHAGQLYLQIGEKVLAYDYLMNAVELDPETSIGWQALRLIERYFP